MTISQQYNPPQIVDKVIPNNTSNSDNFTYEFINLDNDRHYIGKHQGMPLDGYYHSSKNKEFLKDFSNPNSRWKYIVHAYGTKENMLELEAKKLRAVNAAKNPKYYNKTNGSSNSNNIPDIDRMDNIAKHIIANEFTYQEIDNQEFDELCEREKLDKAYLFSNDLERLQSRDESLNTQQKLNLQNEIVDRGGSTEHLTVVVLEDRDKDGLKDGKDLLIGGNHSATAITDCDLATDVYVLKIPKEYHKNWSNKEVSLLANFLNPRPKFSRYQTNDATIVKMVLSLLNDGFTTSSEEVVKIYNIFHLTTSDRQKISKKAKALHAEQARDDLNWVNYDPKSGTPASKDLKKKISDATKKDPKLFCKSYSTGKLDFWGDLRKIAMHNKIADVKYNKVKYFLYHPTEEWKNKHEALAQGDKYTLQKCLESMNIKVQIVYMDETDSNYSSSS